MKNMKKILAVAVAGAMVLSIAGFSAFASDDEVVADDAAVVEAVVEVAEEPAVEEVIEAEEVIDDAVVVETIEAEETEEVVAADVEVAEAETVEAYIGTPVDPRAQSILVMKDKTYTYDGDPYPASADLKVPAYAQDLVTYRYIGEGYDSFVPPTNAGTYRVEAYFPGTVYFEPTMAVSTLTIEKKAVTIQVNDLTADCDEEPEFTYDVVDGSVVDGDDLGVTYEPTFIEEDETTETYTVDGTASNPNYDVTVIPGTLTVKHTPGEPTVIEEKAPTCTEDGYKVVETDCDKCGKELKKETIVIPAKGHTPGETVIENEKEPTCTEPGSYDEVVYCDECDEELSRETIEVPAKGHTPGETVIENEKEPTCTEKGSYDEVVYCDECGEELSRETVEVPMLEHVPGAPVKENEVAPTEDKDGSYDEVIYCDKCDTELNRTTVTVPKTEKAAEEEVAPADKAEKTDATEKAKSVKTGDTTQMGLYLAILVVAFGAIALVSVRRRRNG